MSSSQNGGGSRRRKQTAPKRIVRFDDEQGADDTGLAGGASAGGSSSFLHESYEENDEAQLSGHAVRDEEDIDGSQNYNSDDDGWHVPSLIEGREPRKKKAKIVKSKADKKRAELAKKGT
jgi:hypothetical protein